jgi:hypothetical protein
LAKVKKFSGVKGRLDYKILSKPYAHLTDDGKARSISKDEALKLKTDSQLSSGSINYSLTLGANNQGTHLLSYPFANPATAYSGNGEPDGLESYGFWTPDEIDSEFDNNIWGIMGPGVAATKVNPSPGTTGSANWVGSLTKIWPKHCYWFKVTGSATTYKTITKQLIPANYKTKFDGGWKWLAYPHAAFNNVSPNGYIPDGNSHDMLDVWLREGVVINQLQGQSTAAVYTGSANSGQWQGSFQFQTGSGFMAYDHGGQGVRTGNLFHLMAVSGSDSGETNNDDTGSDDFYTGSADLCFGSGSDYVSTPISNGQLISGEGAGTFQTYNSMDSYTIRMYCAFTGSGGVESSSILNHDNSQMVPFDKWGIPASGSNIEIGIFNLSGSNGGQSGSVTDNSVCFASALWPGHSQATNIGSQHPKDMTISAQLKYTTVSGSVSGSEDAVHHYPTGSDQSSSIKVYSPLCDQVYMARLYEFTSSKDYDYTELDINDAIDITDEITGSYANQYKEFKRCFIKLKNDVI